MTQNYSKTERQALLIEALNREDWNIDNISDFIRKYGGNFQASNRTIRREVNQLLNEMDSLISYSKAFTRQEIDQLPSDC